MTKIMLTTIADVVKAFGGTSGMAEWAGIGASAVSNWIDRDQIPPGWHFRIYRDAAALGFGIDPSVFDDRLRPRKARRQGGASPQSARVA